jgi:hypothetical protein
VATAERQRAAAWHFGVASPPDGPCTGPPQERRRARPAHARILAPGPLWSIGSTGAIVPRARTSPLAAARTRLSEKGNL